MSAPYRRPLSPAAALLLLAGLSGSAAGQEPASSWSPEQLAVIELAGRGPVGIEDPRIFAEWESRYHPDWTYWRMGTEEVRPRDVHMGLVRGVMEGGVKVTGYELTPIRVQVQGDLAVLSANSVETLEQADGSTLVVRYSQTTTFVRESGRWLVYASSLFYPPATPEG